MFFFIYLFIYFLFVCLFVFYQKISTIINIIILTKNADTGDTISNSSVAHQCCFSWI